MPTAKEATDTAKTTLGWTADSHAQYNLWRRKMRIYFENNSIVYRKDANGNEWQLAETYAKKASIGFPASGAALVRGTNNAATQAKAHFKHLLLDVLKKGREQARKAGLPAASGKRKRAATTADSDNEDEDEDEDEEDAGDDDAGRPKKRQQLGANVIPRVVIRVYIVDAQYSDDALPGPGRTKYSWATVPKSQLVILEEASILAVYEAIKVRIDQGRVVRAIYGAISKPASTGETPTDVERITNDKDLEAFLEVARAEYKPICIQVQLAPADGRVQTPPPDERPYFPVDTFIGPDPATLYDAPVSDSENDRYIRAMGKAKKKVWPKSDAGFEHQKNMVRKRLRRLRRHLEALKGKHKEFYPGDYDAEVIDTDNEDAADKYWPFHAWLNPQTGADWVDSRAAVIRGVSHGHTVPAAGRKEAIRAKILEDWGKPRLTFAEGKANEYHLIGK